MPDATITSTASTFGTITGTFAADQSTVTGTVTGIITGTLTGSVGVPGPAGPGVPVGGTAGQFLYKTTTGVDYATDWTTVNLSVYAVKANNLSDLADAGTARTNLGLGSLAVVNDAPSDGSQYARKNAAWEVVSTTPDFISSVSSPLDVTTGNLTVDLSAYLTTATASATYQTLAGMSSYLTTATAATTYYLQTNPDGFQTAADVTTALSPYLLSATAASTYAVIAAGQPTAGTTGQVLTKQSGSNWDSIWTTIIPGDRYLTTSTTSNTIGNGSKTFTIGTGLSYTPTQSITIAYDASNHMHGEVLTYDSGTGVLTVDINHHTGAGTYAAWIVNIAGVVPATSVAWGAITGTLSSQTDLQSALDLKLAAADAATTYAPLAGATFTGVVGFNGASGNVAAKSTGYFKAYTSGLENTDYSLQYDTGLQVVVGGTTVARIASSGILAPSAGITFSDASTQTSAGITAATAASTYQTLSGMSSYLTTSTAASTYQTISGMSSYLTTASAASTYFTIASAANKADLASPTFSGTPSLPTGTTAVTQTAGNNTTAVATTAFVLANAGSTSFATTAQVVAATSTTTALAPANQGFLATNPRLQTLAFINSASASGSGASTTSTPQNFSRQVYLSTLAVGRSAFLFGAVGSATAGFGTSTAKADQVDFSKKVWISGYACMGWTGGTSYIGDANTMCRITLGGYSTQTTGEMTLKGIGLKKVGGVASTVSLTVHNGTTRTDVASSVTVPDGGGIHWQIYSDGTGNVTLYINGTEAATTTAGPTTATASGQACYREQVEAVATPGVRQVMNCNGGWFYTE